MAKSDRINKIRKKQTSHGHKHCHQHRLHCFFCDINYLVAKFFLLFFKKPEPDRGRKSYNMPGTIIKWMWSNNNGVGTTLKFVCLNIAEYLLLLSKRKQEGSVLEEKYGHVLGECGGETEATKKKLKKRIHQTGSVLDLIASSPTYFHLFCEC
ncbi:hypothetical protein HELRODRAFT_179385 [Helobdella robusta]|uniref:Uncharacterized protein n=1 Tax=Helobdella robusta TaxID=6412 RepID=T1FEM8_HELRO|nr:hypothetical protein HELRODRAFT_179385 [Helobdella robusta]ESN95322.1 hypothetical protein HELRODRAFT_179385 [Helobdella robusta]